MDLTIPPAIDAVLARFDATKGAFDLHDLASALTQARRDLGDISESEHLGAWADLIAANLEPWPSLPSPWGGFFGPRMTFVTDEGVEVHQPDITGADAVIVEHWRGRAQALTHPELKARYADLVWDLAPTILATKKRDIGAGRLAFDNYLSAAKTQDPFDGFQGLRRALMLAIAVADVERIAQARDAILALHRAHHDPGELGWQAYDLLTSQKKAGLSDEDLAAFIAELEAALARHSDAAAGGVFDPHIVESVSGRLIGHYRRLRARDDEKRIHTIVAKAVEHHASLGDALLASSLLNDSFEAYRKAGLLDEAERVRRLMEQKIGESTEQMGQLRQEVKITFEQAEAFKVAMVADGPANTLARIGAQFLTRRKSLEDRIAEQAKIAPLMSMLTQTIIDGDRVVASVGSVEDDPYGRVLRQGLMDLRMNTIWLGWAIEAAIETYRFDAGHFTAWANRAGLFGDAALLAAGLGAWLDGDNVKALHVLVPQVERGLRNLVGAVGRPTTKPHPSFKGAHLAVTMGDILYNKDTVAALGGNGDNLAVHLACLYADPRGVNLRNDLAHGLLDMSDLHDGNVLWVVHTLILLGLWRQPATAAEVQPDPAPAAEPAPAA